MANPVTHEWRSGGHACIFWGSGGVGPIEVSQSKRRDKWRDIRANLIGLLSALQCHRVGSAPIAVPAPSSAAASVTALIQNSR